MSSFGEIEGRWVHRLGNLRNFIRQELIARQLAMHVCPAATILDVGCGQGTQALRLAVRGHSVTGVDPSPRLLARFAADATDANVGVELVEGRLDQLHELMAHRLFDVVCAPWAAHVPR